MQRWKLSIMAAVAAGTLLLGACSGNAYGSGSSSTASTTPSSTPSSTSSATGGGRYGNGVGNSGTPTPPGTSTGGASQTVSLSNFTFAPSKISVKKGTTIALKNLTPSTPHGFVIDGQNITLVVAPGTTSDLKINLAPGTYHFHCQFHKALGMTGTLTVG